jgi:hypothetical protein
MSRFSSPTNLSLLCISMLIACDTGQTGDLDHPSRDDLDNGTEQGTDPEGSDPDPEEESFAPVEGTWTVLESAMDMDQCGMADYMDFGQPGGTSELTLNTSDRFTWLSASDSEFTDGGVPLHCTIDADDCFVCDSYDGSSDLASSYGMDADVTYVVEVEGCFESELDAWTATDFTASCIGSDCGTVEWLLGTSFPCDMEFSAVSEASE